MQTNRDKLEAEVEQFYHDDPDKTREQFHSAVQRLKTVDGAEWFIVRNYDQPPPVLAALMSAVCTLMLARDSWKSARNLIGSSVQNMEVRAPQLQTCVRYEEPANCSQISPLFILGFYFPGYHECCRTVKQV